MIGDPTIVSQSLLGLVTPRNESVNQSYVDTRKPFMEFDVPKNQSIDEDSMNQSANKISYEIDYRFGWHTNNIKLINNTTEFQSSLAERGYAKITYRYTEDKNQESRNSRLDDRRNNEADREQIRKEFPVESSLQQRVSFFMWDIKFNKELKMPQELIIWNEYSTELFPCYMIEHGFPHGGASYNVDYTCNKLPNFNDYGGKLKFIFN